ncbi:MAG: 4Fe-4S binding protein [Clostridia bacterium]|nr:4Fe-4S binding protein [Clostridia bacterium]
MQNFNNWLSRLDRRQLRIMRNGIQITLGLILLVAGYRFYLFVRHFDTLGMTPFQPRPPIVEAFLPIGALVSFKLWLTTGIYDPIHPAALSIFITVLLTAFLFRKGFCSWICPIGTISEGIHRLGALIVPQWRLPRFLAYPLLSLKYLVLLVFVKLILIDMPVMALVGFMGSSYNKISDAKMLDFFLDLSPLSVKVLVILFVLSLFIKNFWCRFLCPYGALLSIVSLISPVKIRRNTDLCIDCGKCDKACSYDIKLSDKPAVVSPECTGCLDCVAACPREGSLEVLLASRKKLNPWMFGGMVVGFFLVAIGVAKLTGHWETVLTLEDYARLLPLRRMTGHP